MKRNLIGIVFLLLTFMFTPTYAIPPTWEPSFGAVIAGLTGDDDDQESVVLSFPFPFDGINYTTIFVGTNGDLQLGNLGTDNDIDYDHWSYMDEFLADAAPSIAGFNTDLDLSTTGTIHFNDFGNRAVFTWNEVGTDENETALSTFQVQLFDDGTIIISFNGIMDSPSEDLLNDLGEGIVVGITAGGETAGTEPGPTDLSTSFSTTSTEIYDRWCYDTADSCGYDGSDDGLPGPINTAFDLDQSSIVFTPALVGSGFNVSSSRTLATDIPTLSFWALLLLVTLLLGYSVRSSFNRGV